MSKEITIKDEYFFKQVAELLTTARSNSYRALNTIMLETYWQVGRRIIEEEQKGKDRAEYGEFLIVGLSKYLTDIFGKGFSESNIRNMRKLFRCLTI